ncbi:MAG: hypothetical protein DSY83_13240 [Flavobacteriia bacterium]|nr:MAG: hypothetical protein DSY83_13240 [Flavobacteriia bacterium]
MIVKPVRVLDQKPFNFLLKNHQHLMTLSNECICFFLKKKGNGQKMCSNTQKKCFRAHFLWANFSFYIFA